MNTACAKALMSVLETMFQLPGQGSARGTKTWIDDLVGSPQKATFAQMVKYPEILDTYIMDQFRHHSDVNNNVFMWSDEQPPNDDEYEIPGMAINPRVVSSLYKRHTTGMPFLRYCFFSSLRNPTANELQPLSSSN